MAGVKLSNLPILTTLNPNDTNILMLAVNENSLYTSVTFSLSTLFNSLNNSLSDTINSTKSAAPTIVSSGTIAPNARITFISGTAPISNITPPQTFSGGGQLTLIPKGLWTTNTSGNIALSSTAVVNKALIMVYDSGTGKWYPSY